MIKKKRKYNGTVYLICFDDHYYHAKHYIGFCFGDVKKRLARHKKGDGSRLLRALNDIHMDYRIVRTWKNVDRNFERKLKNRKKSSAFCPRCCKPKRK